MTTGDIPKFIVIEGVDGAGKGVQSRLLRDALINSGIQVILTREPGGSPGAEAIRKLIVEGDADRWDDMTELLLIYAARRSHLQDTILPALKDATWVLCDRFADSSRAFQGIAGNLGLDTVEAIHQQVVGDFKPDLTLVLDIEPSVGLQRAAQRGDNEDRFEKKGQHYQEKVRQGFRQIVDASPDAHELIDASGSVQTVNRKILDVINHKFGLALKPPQIQRDEVSGL